MTRWAVWVVPVTVMVGCLHAPLVRAAAGDEEQTLLAVLVCDKPPAEKYAACDRLKRIGTPASVPTLARLLTDERLSYWARMALESMPYPEAGRTLREALSKTTGKTQAGIIDSLGDRGDRAALPALANLLRAADPLIASSAAAALGKIAGPEAVRALTAAEAAAPPAVRETVTDALLACAARLVDAGDAKAAKAIYNRMLGADRPAHVRTAAFRGLVLASGGGAAALLENALAGADRPRRTAALQLIQEAEGRLTTATLTALLAKGPPHVRVALLGALAERGDKAAVAAVTAATRDAAPAVRVAALQAVAALGDASAVLLLASKAADAEGEEQDAAREALARLRGTGVWEAILSRAATAPPAVQIELVQALGRRGETAAVPALLKMAAAGDEPVRTAAIGSLGVLADEAAAKELITLVVRARADADRAALEKALRAVCGRIERPEVLIGPVLAAMKGAGVPARCVLLRLAGRIGGARALEALRTAIRDADATIQDVAIRTLADTAGPAAAGDLLALARGASGAAHRVLALRGYWRMVGRAADRPVAERWTLCEAGMAASRRADEKKLGLAELANLPHTGALELAQSLCREETVRAEARSACVQIAAALAASHPAAARTALAQIVAETKDDDLRRKAQAALDAMQQYVGYVTGWQVAGPYRKAGKECEALFDIPFPPEQRGAGNVTWKPAPHPPDPALAWQADLASIVGGDHCAVYLKARVYSPAAVAVRLEIGTDDGVKLWINGKLVHANNAIRGLTPGQDKAAAALRQGWNDLLAKITQHTLGCGACVRIRHPDGRVIDGLRFDAAPAGTK